MVRSVEDSLKRLNTDYIDLFYLHAWDFTTSVEEVMRGLDDLVRAGKVVYAGISDTPAGAICRLLQADSISPIPHGSLRKTPPSRFAPLISSSSSFATALPSVS